MQAVGKIGAQPKAGQAATDADLAELAELRRRYIPRGITTAQALTAFHQRFTDAWPAMLRVVVASETAAAVLCAWVLSPWAAMVVVALASGGALVRVRRRRSSPVSPRSCAACG